MKRLRRMLDNVEPLFVKGGRFERFHAIYEMVDTLFYSPPDVTRGSPHIRDAIDLKRAADATPGDTFTLDVTLADLRLERVGAIAWEAYLPEVAEGHWEFRELFVDGERRTRPRYPRDGLLTMKHVPGL